MFQSSNCQHQGRSRRSRWDAVASLACQGPSAPRQVGVVNFSLLYNAQRSEASSRDVASTFFLKISAMDLSAQKTMKSAANCDKQCELQIFEKHQNLERALRFRVTLVSNSASVSSHSTAATGLSLGAGLWRRSRRRVSFGASASIRSLHLDLRSGGSLSVLLTLCSGQYIEGV